MHFIFVVMYPKFALVFTLLIQSSLASEIIKPPCAPCVVPTTPAPKYTPSPCRLSTCHTACTPCVVPTTPPPPPKYTPSPCRPPTCYTDRVAQKAQLEKIYKEGSQMMVDYTDTATGPVVYIAHTIDSGAELLSPIFAAGGDFLGKAIAAPIRFFNRLGFGLLTSAISQVVTIPISLGTSVRASTVTLQPYLRWMGLSNLPSSCCPPPPGQTGSSFEQIGLKPIGILTGPIHLALGSVLKLGGSTFKLIGTLTKSGGEFVENSGLGLKNIGALKVADGVSSVASFLSTINDNSGNVICVETDKQLNFYEKTKTDDYAVTTKPYSETPAPKYIPKTDKYIPKTDKYNPTTVKYNPTTVGYASTKEKYVPTTPKYVPTTLKYVPSTKAYTTEKYQPTTPAYVQTTAKYYGTPAPYGSTSPPVVVVDSSNDGSSYDTHEPTKEDLTKEYEFAKDDEDER